MCIATFLTLTSNTFALDRCSLLKLKVEGLEEYLSGVYKADAKVKRVFPLGGDEKGEDLKGFGYGIPFVIEFSVNGESKRVVLETMRPEGFGHDYASDRAGILLWQHSAFNRLPRHVRSVDVGAFTRDGEENHNESATAQTKTMANTVLANIFPLYRYFVILTPLCCRRLQFSS